jgi:hypothetical protein
MAAVGKELDSNIKQKVLLKAIEQVNNSAKIW